MSFHRWPKSGTSAEVWIGEKATDLTTHLCDTALGELTSKSWHVRQRLPSSRDHTRSFHTVWHFKFEAWEGASLLPSTSVLSPCWLGPHSGARRRYLQQILFKSSPWREHSLHTGNNLEAIKNATYETWVIPLSSFCPSDRFTRLPLPAVWWVFSVRMRQATYLYRLSLSFSFLKWAAILLGCWWVIINCFFKLHTQFLNFQMCWLQ